MANIQSKYPQQVDEQLKIPRTPTVAKLSEAEAPDDFGYAGQNENSHSDLHAAENNSIKALERHALVDDSSFSHDHSDPYDVDYSSESYALHPDSKKGRQLRVKNTHVFTNNKTASDMMSTFPDTDFSGIHHSLGGDDGIGLYQGVSGTMWRNKGLIHVPDHYFDSVDQLGGKWDSSVIIWPGNDLAAQILALMTRMKNLLTRVTNLENRVDKHEQQINDLIAKSNSYKSRLDGIDRTLRDILAKVYKGGTINSDGSITWGQPETWARIPIGDLNIFSKNVPDNNTMVNSIRTRNLHDDDVRVQ